MTTAATLTTKTPSGIEIILSGRIDDFDGRAHFNGGLPSRKINGAAQRPQPIAERDGATFRISIGMAHVGLTATEAARVGEWMDAIETEAAATPAAIRQALREDRLAICEEIRGGHEDVRIANERAWERGDESNAFRSFDDSGLRAKLAAFDVAHPEIIEAIRAEKDEAHRRFLAAD